jgi:phage portal protein BeeE
MFGRQSAPADLQARASYDPLPGWAGPPLIANVNFGNIGPTVTLSMNLGDMQRTLQACAWAYLGITANAEAIAELPPVVQVRKGNQWVRDENHPLNKLITAPLGSTSSPPNWSWSDWLKVAAIHLQMADVGFVARIASGLSDPWPVALWPLIFEALSIDETPQHWPAYYRHGSEGTYRADQVVHLRKAHPTSFTQSMSVFRAALPSIQIDAIARQRVQANLNNRIAPGVLIAVKGYDTISPEKQRATLAAIREQVGLSTQDGTPMVGGEGWQLLAPPPNAGETGANPARVEARREILAVVGCPESMVTTVEADRSSQAERRISWWERTLFGLSRDIYSQLTAQIVPADQAGKVRLWYDLSGSDVALALLDRRASVGQKLVTMGYSPNDAAERVQLDMPNRPELDQPNQAQVIAGREPMPETPEPAADDADEDDAEDPEVME